MLVLMQALDVMRVVSIVLVSMVDLWRHVDRGRALRVFERAKSPMLISVRPQLAIVYIP